jgi:hypothetical protein
LGYFIRVLGYKDKYISFQEVRDRLANFKGIKLSIEAGTEKSWGELFIEYDEDSPVATIERFPTSTEIGKSEIEGFIEEIEDYKPKSAVKWLKKALPKVRVVYMIRIFDGVYKAEGWNAVHAVQGYIWNKTGGILQADGEGLSNENGYHILWQFSDKVEGSYKMAIKNILGGWTVFEMDLGNIEHRQAFLNGKVPKGVRRLN